MQNYLDEIQKYHSKVAVIDNPVKDILMLLPGIILALTFLLHGSSQLLDRVEKMNNIGATETTTQQKVSDVQTKSGT